VIPRRPSDAAGFALVAVVFLVVILAGLSVALLGEAAASRTALVHNESSVGALEMAETGLVAAETEIRALKDWGTDGIGFVTDGLGNGTYAITATQNTVNPDRWHLSATGALGHSVRRVEVEVRRRADAMWVDALFSEDSVTLGGGSPTDAYDSRLGTYQSQAVNADAAGTYALSGGSIGSNGDIELNGSGVRVRGNAIPGPLRTVEMSGGATVTGDISPRNYEVPLDPVPLSEFQAALLNNMNNAIQGGGQGNTVRYQSSRMTLEITGGATMVMPPGTYFFSEMTLKGNSTVRITGPTKIYVTSLLDFAAGAKLIADRPGDVELYVHPYPLPTSMNVTESRVKVNSGSSITWALYAPEAQMDLGGGNDFYGAAVARSVSISGGNAFHYDIALGQAKVLGAARIERLYWRESSPPRR
jgi:hypothetical protein